MAEAGVPSPRRSRWRCCRARRCHRRVRCWRRRSRSRSSRTPPRRCAPGSCRAAKADAVVSAAAVAPDAEDRRCWRSRCGHRSAKLREESLKARAGVDRDAAHARIRRERHLREFIDAEGAWNLHARGPVDDGAEFRAALEPLIDEQFKTKRRSRPARAARGVRVRRAHRSSATASGALRATPSRAGHKRSRSGTSAMHPARLRRAASAGAVEGEEICEIAGLGPIPVRIARDLLGDAILSS